MATTSETEFLKHAIVCPVHGHTHVVQFRMPEPGEYFAAHYVCAQCATAPAAPLTAGDEAADE